MGGAKSEVTASELRERIAHAVPPVILDVRSRREFLAGHIPGAIHMPFWAVRWRAHRLRAGSDDPIVVYCGHGPRARFARRGAAPPWVHPRSLLDGPHGEVARGWVSGRRRLWALGSGLWQIFEHAFKVLPEP